MLKGHGDDGYAQQAKVSRKKGAGAGLEAPHQRGP